MTRSRALVLAVLAALFLLGTACGSDDDTPSASNSATADSADDEALAKRAVLTAADLPAGYEADTEESEDDTTSTTEGEDENDPLDECLGEGGDDLDDAISAEAESPTFQFQQEM